MKKGWVVFVLLFLSQITFAQKEWFSTFTDSTALVKQANQISSTFIKDIAKIKPTLVLTLKTYFIKFPSKFILMINVKF